MNRRTIIWAVVIAVVLAGGGLGYYFIRPAEPQQLENVSIRLSWVPQAQFAGEYIAQNAPQANKKTLYAQQGLDVIILPGGPNIQPPQLVAGGAEQFGLVTAAQFLVARAKGLPLVAIAATIQQSPIIFLTLKDSGITKPQDFIGKRVGIKPGTSLEYVYAALLNKLGIDRSKIEEIPIQVDITPLLTRQVDVWPGVMTNEFLTAREKGFEINVISPSDYGVDLYGDVLFTTEKIVGEKPKLVKRFVKATLAGWQWAIDHPDVAVGIVLKQNDTLVKPHESAMLTEMIKLIQSTDTKSRGLGWMSDEKWQSMIGFLKEQKVIDPSVNLGKFWTDDFLMR